MNRFDTSCELPEKEIGIIKNNIKVELGKRLPALPEHVEMKLFFEGRDAWVYSWQLRERPKGAPEARLYLEVIAKLKKEFKYIEVLKRYRFLCEAQPGPSIYYPEISIYKEDD
jgi:hypothetical protein